MTNFENCLQVILKNEGGYSNNPSDKGGETYKGISRKNWPQWSGWTAVDGLKGQPDFPESIDSNIGVDSAVKMAYKNHFWNSMRLDEIANPRTALLIFDFAVNSGVIRAVKIAQEIVGVETDGAMGKISIATINSFDPDMFEKEYKAKRIERFYRIVEKNPSQSIFLNGWIKRVNEL
jgi:lysozyme family protein